MNTYLLKEKIESHQDALERLIQSEKDKLKRAYDWEAVKNLEVLEGNIYSIEESICVFREIFGLEEK